MRTKWIVGLAVVVVVGLLAWFGPRVYAEYIAEDSAPAATVDTSGAVAAEGDINGDWTVVPGGGANTTAAGYTVDEVLNGADVTVVGTTQDVSGSVTVADDQLTAGSIVVQTATITTDSDRRDNQFRNNIFDVAANPTATFTVTEPADLSALPTDGTSGTVALTGTLELAGQTQPVTVQADALRSGAELVVSGSIPITFADYGIEPPSLGFVTVENAGTVDFLVVLDQS